MSMAQIIPVAINLSLFLVVFALGLSAQRGDALRFARQPGLLLRSLLAMNVIMAVVAVAISALFDLPAAVKIALVVLAVSPVPPVLPAKQAQAGGANDYAISLMVTASLAAIVLAPALVAVIGAVSGTGMAVAPGRVASAVLFSVVLPLLAGITVRFLLPDLAARIARPLSLAGTACLALAFLPVLLQALPAFWALVGNGVLLALAAFSIAGLLVGHLLGGPAPEDRAVLALAAATRHPGVALAIAAANFPDEKAALAVVLYHLVIGALVCAPYVARARKRTGLAKAAP